MAVPWEVKRRHNLDPVITRTSRTDHRSRDYKIGSRVIYPAITKNGRKGHRSCDHQIGRKDHCSRDLQKNWLGGSSILRCQVGVEDHQPRHPKANTWYLYNCCRQHQTWLATVYDRNSSPGFVNDYDSAMLASSSSFPVTLKPSLMASWCFNLPEEHTISAIKI